MTDENGMNTTMLMTPANGVPYMGGFGGNNGLFGGGDSWLGILFLIALCNGGFGFGGGFGGGYGNDAKMDFMAEVESLMNRAPDEHTRMKIERMLNDLR